MPLVQVDATGHKEDISPEEALSRGLCPECGADFKIVNALGHRRTHWMVEPPRDELYGGEGRRRIKLYDQYLVDNKVRTTNMPVPKEEKDAGKAVAEKAVV